MNTGGIHDWIWRFLDEATARRDRDRLHLYHDTFCPVVELDIDPGQKVRLLDEGQQLAERLGEPWWSLIFQQLRVLHLLGEDQCNPALNRAVQAVLDLRKPVCALFPGRFCQHVNLARCYLAIDAPGYEEEIQEVLRSMDRDVPPEYPCRHCLTDLWSSLYLATGRWNDAERKAPEYFAQAAAEPDKKRADQRSMSGHHVWCVIAQSRADWPALAEHARAGAGLARRSEEWADLASFLVWQALAARHGGSDVRARRLHHQAVNQTRRAKRIGRWYYDALCGYYEVRGEWGEALAAREQESQELSGKGRLDEECRCRLNLCRLLARLGRPLDTDLTLARQAAERLRRPARYMEEIDRLARAV